MTTSRKRETGQVKRLRASDPTGHRQRRHSRLPGVTRRGGGLSRAIHLERLEPRICLDGAGFTFVDSFEAGLSSHWRIPSLTGDGNTEVTDLVSVNAGGRSLLFHSAATTAGADLNEAILSLDLTSAVLPLLTFHQFEGILNETAGDGNDPLGDEHVVTAGSTVRPAEAQGDGLTISNDGLHWYKLRDVTYDPNVDYGTDTDRALAGTINRSGDGLWLLHEYDLAAEITRINTDFPTAGLELNSAVQIKFSQYGERSFPEHGWAIDKVQVTDQPQLFTLALEPGVFHRLSLPGEVDADFQYRLGMFGHIDATTPILLSVHGGDRVIDGYTHAWSKFFALPDTPSENVIVVAPYFTIGGDYDGYNRLSWGDNADGRTADGVTIDLIEQIVSLLGDALGGVQDHPIYLYGHSGGGQFAERFLWAHPNFLDATVVSSPAYRTPIEPNTPYPYGIGPNPGQPAPEGVDLVANVDDFLSSRIMFWVGDSDKAPDDWMNNSGLARKMGYGRLQRTVNMYEMVYDAALSRIPFTNDFEYEVYISEGRGHGGKSMSDFAAMYAFLFRDPITQPPIQIHPLIVYTPSSDERRVDLPPSTDSISPGSDFYLELWLEAPVGSAVRSGSVEIIYDTDLVDALALDVDHGLFDRNVTGVVDDSVGRIRSFGGTTNLWDAGVGDFSLFGRIHFQAGATLDPIPSQIAFAIEPGAEPFVTVLGETTPARYLPVERLDIAATSRLGGSIYHDADGDGRYDADEQGVRGVEVRLETSTDSSLWQAAETLIGVYPLTFEPQTVVNSASSWMTITATGSDVSGYDVAAVVPDPVHPERMRLSWCDMGTSGELSWNARWQDDRAELRVDFASAVSYVSVEAYGGDSAGSAKVEVYNAAGELLETYVTPSLASGALHVVEITRPSADIAYAIASSNAGSSEVCLGAVAFLLQPAAVTDEFGNYWIRDLDRLFGLGSSEFRVAFDLPAVWESTSPSEQWQRVVVEEGRVLPEVNFGIVPAGHGIGPDLVGTSLSVVNRNLYLSGGDTTVHYTLANNTFVDTAGLDVQFYLSEDPIIDPDDPADILVPLAPSAGGHDALRIGAGVPGLGETSGVIALRAPATDPFGSTNHYYLGMMIDAGGEIDEYNEANNVNRGLTIDLIDVTYAVPATFPFLEDWESGGFDEHWEVIPAAGIGRIQVTSAHDPYSGDSHVVLDHNQFYGLDSSNQLILHIDLSGQSEVLLGAANREWNDGDDSADRIDFAFDDLRSPSRIVQLTDTSSTNTYEQRWYEVGCSTCYFVQDTLIRFQQHGEAMVPHDGMAFDDIQVVPALADLAGTSLSVSEKNLQNAAGTVQASFSIANATPHPAEDVSIRFYLSEDPYIDASADMLLSLSPNDPHYNDSAEHHDFRVSLLAGDSEFRGDIDLVVPESDPLGGGNHYYLGMVIDAGQQIDELDDDNNANRGIGIDVADVIYITPARPPLLEGWETGNFADCWEAVSDVGGRIAITRERGPFEGEYHVVMDHSAATVPQALNQLILHVDLSGLSGLELSWANREWDDHDDVGLDKISISTDDGETWRNIMHLVHTNSTNGYVWHSFDLDSLDLSYTSETQIRFQQQSNDTIPADGMALDSIHLGPEASGPRVVRHAPFGRVVPGGQDIEFTFSEPMQRDTFSMADVTSFAGPGGSDLKRLLTNFYWKDVFTLVVRTPPLVDSGLYTMVIGPYITDDLPSLNPMDQDADGRKGETEHDRYRASFMVVEPLHFADMETDPLWTLDAGTPPYQWQRGMPEGGGSQVPGPAEAVSGANVLGYNLHGDYANGMSSEFATTPAIDTRGYEQVVLTFYQWLSVEAAPGDRATVQVSHDGITWGTVYENPAQHLFADQWSYRVIDIAAVADDQPTVYVRWGMGPTNATAAYAGWYLDDVMVSGLAIDASLPAVAVTDSQGDAHDRAVDFGAHDAFRETLSYEVTVANTGGSDLTISEIELSDLTNYAISWDGAGDRPATIAAGSHRVATITYAPQSIAEHPATLMIVTNDPSPADGTLVVQLTGSGEATVKYGWTHTFGSSGFDAARAIEIDSLGNMVIGGFFEGTIDFDPSPYGTESYTAVGSRDAFVSKYTPAGKHLWTWTVGSTHADEVFDLAIDSEDNVLISGEFRLTVDFNGSEMGGTYTSNGYNDVFVTRLGADGRHHWTRAFGGTSSDTGDAVAVDSKGDVFVAGSFWKTVDFDAVGGTAKRTSTGKNDVYLVHYRADGAFIDVKTFGGASTDLAKDVALDAKDNIVLDGLFFGTSDFDPGPGTDLRNSAGYYDVFVTRLSAGGDYDWTRTIGGIDDEEAGGVAVDDHGNVYLTGAFQDTVVFDPVGQSDTFTSPGGYSTFVTRLHHDGSYGWTRVFGGTATGYGRGLVVADHVDLLVTGSFYGVTDFNPFGGGDAFVSKGMSDIFVTRYSLNGVYGDTQVVGGTGNDYAMDVAAGSAYVAGFFEKLVDFDPTDGTDIHLAQGSSDIFAGRLFQSNVIQAEIRGTVWNDFNGDGDRDTDEPALAGWTIFLDADNDGVLAPNERSTVSGADGRYQFDGLVPGLYSVAQVIQPNWSRSAPDDGSGDGSHMVLLAVGEVVSAIDFGSYLPAIGERVWDDADGDGYQDVGEDGLAGVIVHLYGGSTAGGFELLRTVTTDLDGQYAFRDLVSGEYYVEFVRPEGYLFTLVDQRESDEHDSDAATHSGRTEVFSLAAGELALQWDAGLWREGSLAAIGDDVWNDANGNGLQDIGETGVANIVVSLYRPGGISREAALVTSTVTDANGRYAFLGVPPGEYFLRFDMLPGLSLTLPGVGHSAARDSDPDPSTQVTSVFTVSKGMIDLSWDAGVLDRDFGDAPDPMYPTWMASGGAYHYAGGRYLGTGVESDPNGQPDARAG